jgi:hypothetical protein
MIPLALAIASIGADRLVPLDWKPALGEIHRYTVSVQFRIEGAHMEFSSLLETKVLGVAEDGSYRLSTRTLHAMSKSAGGETPLPDEPPSVERFDRRGLPLAKAGDKKELDPFSDLLDHLTEYQSPGHPVRVGDSWVNEVGGPKQSLFGEPRISYRLSELTHSDSGDYARVSYTAANSIDPFAATGSLIVARPDNHLVHLDVVIPHFMPEGSREEARVQIILQEKS